MRSNQWKILFPNIIKVRIHWLLPIAKFWSGCFIESFSRFNEITKHSWFHLRLLSSFFVRSPLLIFLFSALNPIIYGFMCKSFRENFTRTVSRSRNVPTKPQLGVKICFAFEVVFLVEWPKLLFYVFLRLLCNHVLPTNQARASS